jgi:hypothetical protein
MRVVLLSQNEEDKRFYEQVATKAGLGFQCFTTAVPMVDDLARDSSAIVITDATTAAQYSAFENCVADKLGLYSALVNPNYYFFVSSHPFSACTHLHSSQLLGNFIERRYKEKDQDVLASVFQRFASENAFGLEKYFSPMAKQQVTQLKRSLEKAIVLEATRDFLQRWAMNTRASALIINAIDELLLNAFYEAPVDNLGKNIYANTARNTPLELTEGAEIELKMIHDDESLGISVADPYGSLDRIKIISLFTKNYKNEDYKPKANVVAAGLGLNDTYLHSAGIIFAWEPGVRSEVMLFFKKNKQFRPFREQLRFFSTFTNAL